MLELSYLFVDHLNRHLGDMVTFTRDGKTLRVQGQNGPFVCYQAYNWYLGLNVIKTPGGGELRQVTLTTPYCGMYDSSVPVFPSNIWPRSPSHQKRNTVWLNALGSTNPEGAWMKFDATIDASNNIQSLSHGALKITYSGWKTLDGYSFPTQIHETNYEFIFHKCLDQTWTLNSVSSVPGTIDVLQQLGSPLTITDLRLMPKAHYAWTFTANNKENFWQSVQRKEGMPGDPAYPPPRFTISAPSFSLGQWFLIFGLCALGIGLFIKYKERLSSLLPHKKAK